MTVRGETGDAGGDPATPPPATVQARSNGGVSPERLLGGRFWVLESSDEEEDGDMEEISTLGDSVSVRYLCRSPSSESDRDLQEGSQELARRAIKRINRQRMQRMAATAALEFMSPEGTSSPISMPLGMSVHKSKPMNLPILEPSVFEDDGLEGWTVVRRRHWSPASGKRSRDPANPGISNFRGLGPVQRQACAASGLVRGGPKIPIHRVPVSTQEYRSDGADRPLQVKVGNAVAGRAFRRLLGFVWRKIEKGEPVVQRRSSKPLMNGEGGQGGFNPGRGGFNNGRGGFHARGGYDNGRGANGARGRLSQGGGRGGQGYAGGRGFQGNTNPGFGRNYVQGESSGIAGMNNGAGFREENWGGPRNSSSNFHNNNRSGYGNNQQRWISGNNVGRGGGYQNRFHGHGHGAARNTIDADLLQQTVQAVVAAVTAAQKNPVSVGGVARNNAVSTNDASAVQSQSMVMPVAAPSDIQQQSAMLNKDAVEAQVAGANVKENEGPGPLKKKKEDKTACFRCKKPGHYIDDCTTPYCDICGGSYGSQEVNMVDANNGNDGGGDAHNGEGNNAGGNTMDMDTKGADDDATSNNNGQDVPNTRNGVEGMQEQCQHVEEIQIGTMKVQLSPADTGSSRSAPGLPMVGPREARLGAVIALLRRPAAPAAPLSADRVHVQDRRASSSMQLGSQSGLDTRQQAAGGAGGPGSSAPGTFPLNEQLCSVSQKILPAAGTGPALGEEAKGSHWPMMSIDGQSLLPDADAAVGSSVHAHCVANGNVLEPNVPSSLEYTEGKDGDESMRHIEEGLSSMGVRNMVGIASSPMTNVCPTIEEVIAFGGIPKVSTGVRSSSRLGNQADVDLPQMEKAMKKA
ncbi:hypothetical protein ACQ4PT_000783 [Festuca glaucescens]